MSRLLCGVLMALAVVCLPSLPAEGQMAGSRAGLGGTGAAGLPESAVAGSEDRRGLHHGRGPGGSPGEADGDSRSAGGDQRG